MRIFRHHPAGAVARIYREKPLLPTGEISAFFQDLLPAKPNLPPCGRRKEERAPKLQEHPGNLKILLKYIGELLSPLLRIESQEKIIFRKEKALLPGKTEGNPDLPGEKIRHPRSGQGGGPPIGEDKPRGLSRRDIFAAAHFFLQDKEGGPQGFAASEYELHCKVPPERILPALDYCTPFLRIQANASFAPPEAYPPTMKILFT
jgi:hypothetical protein